MMPDEDLDELAEDIKSDGQLHPIIVDKDGILIDGRNRLEACRRVGVEPTFERLPDGIDPVAFILSNNITRCHLTKGQKAMAAAMARRLLKNNKSTTQAAKEASISQPYLVLASVVLEHAPKLAPFVLGGSLSLKDAYARAQEAKHEAESDEAKAQRIRTEAPDLADLVAEERIPPGPSLRNSWLHRGRCVHPLEMFCLVALLAYTKLPHVDVRKRSFVPTADAVVTHSLTPGGCSRTRRTAQRDPREPTAKETKKAYKEKSNRPTFTRRERVVKSRDRQSICAIAMWRNIHKDLFKLLLIPVHRKIPKLNNAAPEQSQSRFIL
jgi:ParB-like nuclease domain